MVYDDPHLFRMDLHFPCDGAWSPIELLPKRHEDDQWREESRTVEGWAGYGDDRLLYGHARLLYACRK